MRSVSYNENTIIIKNSRFITLVYPIQNVDDVEKHLGEAKIKYPNATHYCYAYILDGISRESDDGEPSGTAGVPILQVLEKNELNHVLCIVIRYFGKIKLGVGGLVRAYTKSTVLCLKNHIVYLKKGFSVFLFFDYQEVKRIDYLLKDSIVLDKKFNENICYHCYISQDILSMLKSINEITIELIDEVYF